MVLQKEIKKMLIFIAWKCKIECKKQRGNLISMLLFIFSQVMFEKYGFQGVYIAIQAVLTLYAQGITMFNF